MQTYFKIAVGIIVVVPLMAAAQSDALRSQIRTDLMRDPRAANLAPAEFDGMVEALAEQAERDGTAQDYLDGKNVPDYSAAFAATKTGPSLWSVLKAPSIVALIALVIVLVAVVTFIVRRKHRPAFYPEM